MTLGQSISTCLSKYATFSGRATRSEYWWFALFGLMMSWGASIVGVAMFGEGGAAFNLVPTLALLIPSLSAMVRRFHDTGRSGWNYWWCATIIGVIPVFIWLASEGDSRENSYGPPPAN